MPFLCKQLIIMCMYVINLLLIDSHVKLKIEKKKSLCKSH